MSVYIVFNVVHSRQSKRHSQNAYVDTRNTSHLYLAVVSLSCVQKRVSYSGSKSLIAFQAIFGASEMTEND